MPGPDPTHWLHRYTPREWVRAAMGELVQARAAFERHNGRAGLAGCRRAAGVALNGILAAELDFDPAWGRTYMDHLTHLAADLERPEAVRDAAKRLLATPLPGGEIVALRTARSDDAALEAAELIMAHAYAMVLRAESAAEK